MHSFRISWAFILLALMVSFGMPGAATEKALRQNPVVSASTKFGFKLFSQIKKDASGGNIFFSPSSIAWCLSMVVNGAQGETRREMAQALEVTGINLQDLNQAFAEWRNTWVTPDPKVEMEVANSIWARRGIGVRPEFLQTSKRFYFTEVSELDFDDSGAPETINSWVKTKTRGKISKIVDQIEPESALFLINAIYFKGKWTHEFDDAKTKEDSFTTVSGSQKRLPMMRQRGTYPYYEQPEFQAVSLPYGDRRLSMYIFLPAKGVGLQEFQRSLTAANWHDWISKFHKAEGDIVLPRFRVEYDVTLNDSLKALGMQTAFDPQQADFGSMLQTSKNAFISKVKHKAFVEVNEQGTEAAAATSTEVQIISMPLPAKTFQMIVNRPFFFGIRDNTTGAVLFIGSISDPA